MTTPALPTRQRVLTPSQRVLRITDGDTPYNTIAKVVTLMKAVPSGQKAVIWAMSIKAQEAARFGFTGIMPPYTVGRFNFAAGDISTANDFVEGDLNLVVNTADGRHPIETDSIPTTRLHNPARGANASMASTFTNDVDSTYVLAEMGILAEEDDLLQVEFSPFAAVPAALDQVAMNLPVTRYS